MSCAREGASTGTAGEGFTNLSGFPAGINKKAEKADKTAKMKEAYTARICR